MKAGFDVVVIKFRDIPDVINRREMTHTFQSRVFKSGDYADEMRAVNDLWNDANKKGFTRREVIKSSKRALEVPDL